MTKKGSIKETSEEIPQEEWNRSEAAVYPAVKSGSKHRVAFNAEAPPIVLSLINALFLRNQINIDVPLYLEIGG